MDVHMEEALEIPTTIPKRYGRIARWYDRFTDYETRQHLEAVRLVGMDPRSRVLDVACGTGRGLAALSARLEPNVERYGVDLTPGMLERARTRMTRLGLNGVTDLSVANASQLPFPDGQFDVVYSGYFFDLVKIDEMPRAIGEMRRVLKPGGTLVLVNMSKNTVTRTRYEHWYSAGRLGVFSGGCRPVIMGSMVREAGFAVLQRHYRENRSIFFLNRMFGTEILIARW